MTKRPLTLSDIAGYATERTVWQMLLDLAGSCQTGSLTAISPKAIAITGSGFAAEEAATDGAPADRAFAPPETFNGGSTAPAEQTDVWAMGALAFHAITGMHVFEGKGGETQTADTAIPRISSAHGSYDLSLLICRCLNYNPAARPTKDEIVQQARSALAKAAAPRKRMTSLTGKRYASSLVSFWPEEMVSLIIAIVFMLCPKASMAQSSAGGFSTADIPEEMASLVLRCIDLRSPQNAEKVGRAMDRDISWTMMDELAIDKTGECTTRDAVDMFGLNDMGFGILKRHGGITNAGGRFRDGRDPRYKYSFIEITVKRGKTVGYTIDGREGVQLFAIVPFEKDAAFEADIAGGDMFCQDGICYIRLRQGLKKTDSFRLTLANKSGKNMAFALINYNSRNDD